MPTMLIFGGMFLLSVCAWALVLRSVIVPRLTGLERHEKLALLALPECFRHVSGILLIPGVTNEGISPHFVESVVSGDVLTALLAMATVVALRCRARFAIHLTWVFNVIGMADLLKNVGLGLVTNAPNSFAAAAIIPTMGVPLMLLLHLWIFVELAHDIRDSHYPPQDREYYYPPPRR